MAESIAVGAALGLTVASVPGPGWVLTIERTLARGWAAGMSSGAGIATVHGAFGAVAAYGVTAVAAELLADRRWLALAGGAVLVALGAWRLARRTDPVTPGRRRARRSRHGARRRLIGSYLSMVAFTVTNPQAIVTFLAGFAALRQLGVGAPELAATAVAAGSLAWWAVLTTVVAAVRRRLSDRVIATLRRGSGVVLVTLGLLAVAVAWGVW
jgi:threonine/homoserine/homoserine lactone efflux protein